MNKQEIKDWLKKYYITNYTINDDLTVDVHTEVYLWNNDLTKFTFQFRTIEGNFDCSHNQLTSLYNGPKEVHGSFWCYNNNQLTSLEHCPKIILGFLFCTPALEKDPNYLRWKLSYQLSKL